MASGDKQTGLLEDTPPSDDLEAQIENKPVTLGSACLKATPMSINNLLFTANMVIGGMVISDLPDADEYSVAAGGVINTTQTWVYVTLQVTLFCMMILISGEKAAIDEINKTEKKRALTEEEASVKANAIQEISKVAKAGKVLALLLSIPGSAAMYFAGDLLGLLGQKPEIIAEVTPYFHIMTAAFPIMMYVETNKQIAFGLGRSWLHNAMGVLNLLTIGLGYCFMTGALFSIKMEIPGLALGYLLSHVVNGLVFDQWYKRNPAYNQYNFSVVNLFSPTQTCRNISESWSTVKLLWSIGWPILINLFSELFAVYMTNVFAGWLLNPGQAESMNEVVTQFSFLFIIIQVGLTNAATPIASYLFNRNETERAKIRRMGHLIMGIGFSIAALVLVASLVFNKLFASGYIKEGADGYDSMMHQLKAILPTMMGIQIADAIRNISIGMLRGINDTRYPMYVSVVTQMGISMIGCALGTFVLGKNLEGITVGYGAGILVGTAIVYKRFLAQTTPEQLENLRQQSQLDIEATNQPVAEVESQPNGIMTRLTNCLGFFKICSNNDENQEAAELDDQAQYERMESGTVRV